MGKSGEVVERRTPCENNNHASARGLLRKMVRMRVKIYIPHIINFYCLSVIAHPLFHDVVYHDH